MLSVVREGQAALTASQRQLAEAQRIAHLGSFELDCPTGACAWSDEYYRILGVDPATEPSGALFATLVHPDDGRAVARAWSATAYGGEPFDLVHRIVRPATGRNTVGEVRWVHGRAAGEADGHGTIVKVVGTLLDITERVEAERVREAAETQFEIGFEQSAIGAAIVGLDGIPSRVNPAICLLLDRPAEELVGRDWRSYTHPDEVPLGLAASARLMAGHDLYEDERRYVRPDGSIVWASAYITLVRDAARQPQYYFAQFQDITSRKKLEHELAHLALHDPLTGVPNRVLLTDRIAQSLARARRASGDAHVGVVFVDIDDGQRLVGTDRRR
jgi:PAS domain S-box-containing protein